MDPVARGQNQPIDCRERDCIVIGGGPAGATVAALLAEKGRDVLLLDRSSIRRFHVGESLMPETYWTLKRLGILEKLKASEFPRKYSVQFINDRGGQSAPFYFFESNPHESSITWQVWRADFDALLLENAQAHGAELKSELKVSDVLFEGDRAVGVRLGPARSTQTAGPAEAPRREAHRQEAGAETQQQLRAKVIVDATGQSSLIANRLGLRRPDPFLKKSSIWTYYRGAQRDRGIDEGATLILHSQAKKSWFWYVPLPNNVVSVGVVGSINYLLSGRQQPEEIFQRELGRCPMVQDRLAMGQQFGPVYVTKDFSYHTSRAAGPGWVLVGDALGFLDPIYSSGVFLAMKSGEWAADAIEQALGRNDCSEKSLGHWTPKFFKGMDSLRKLVYAFYTPEFSFGSFIRQHPEQKKNLVSLLVGDVFRDGVDEIFDLMDPMVQPPKTGRVVNGGVK